MKKEVYLMRKTKPVSLAEWQQVVEKDADLMLTRTNEQELGHGFKVVYKNEGLAFHFHSGPDHDEGSFIDLRYGLLIMENPGKKDLKKLRSLARQLGAEVIIENHKGESDE